MAMVDYFLKIEGVEGESQDDKHKNEIQIESFSWGASNMGSANLGGGMGAGKAQMQDFSFVMRVNKASPKLMLACANGQHFPKAVLTCRKAGKEQQEYLKYTFSDVMVSSYTTNGSGGDVVPVDAISLNYTKIEYEYKEQDAKGTLKGAVKAWYDLKTQKFG